MVVCLLLISGGCVRYDYRRIDSDGARCDLTIWSMREITAGSIRLSKSCALTGGADEMKYSEQMMLNIGEMIKKIP